MGFEQQGITRGRKAGGNCELHILQKYHSFSPLPSSPGCSWDQGAPPAEGPYFWVDREPLRAGSLLPLFPLFKFYRVNPELVRNLLNTDPFEPDRKTAPVSRGSGALGWVGSNP